MNKVEKNNINLKILNYRRISQNKKPVKKTQYEEYLSFKDFVLKDLKKQFGGKQGNGHFSIDAFLSLKKRGRI